MSKELADMTLAELWELFPIELAEHNPLWADWYVEEAAALSALLGERIVRIDHIGSTAVSGLLAKPIVDILLQVRPECAVLRLREALAAGGWLVMAEDSAYGELDLNKGYTPQGFADKVFHLHVRRAGEWDEPVFRDYLRTHPQAVREYAALKRKLAIRYRHNRDAYTQAKGEFIRACVAAALLEAGSI